MDCFFLEFKYKEISHLEAFEKIEFKNLTMKLSEYLSLSILTLYKPEAEYLKKEITITCVHCLS